MHRIDQVFSPCLSSQRRRYRSLVPIEDHTLSTGFNVEDNSQYSYFQFTQQFSFAFFSSITTDLPRTQTYQSGWYSRPSNSASFFCCFFVFVLAIGKCIVVHVIFINGVRSVVLSYPYLDSPILTACCQKCSELYVGPCSLP